MPSPMLLWIVLALMTAAATLAVILPLARGRKEDASTAEHETAVYRDQLAELDRDRERGLIGAGEAEAARAEIARRLLRAGEKAGTAEAGRSFARPVAAAAMLLLPVVSVWVYMSLGAPEIPDQPLAARLQQQPDPNDVAGMLARVEAHLVNNPADAQGWMVVAPIYMRIGRYADAADAFGRIIRLSGSTADLQEAYGEALVAAGQGLVSADAQKAFESALEIDPERIKARFYRAEGLLQSGRQRDALADYDRIIGASPADAPWLEAVRGKRGQALAALGMPADTAAPDTLPPAASPGPGAADVAAAAAMSEDERKAMIDGMVQQLADRLAGDPNDAEGWQRLIRAYGVLGREEDAKAAYEKARAALAADPAALQAIEAAAAEAGVSG